MDTSSCLVPFLLALVLLGLPAAGQEPGGDSLEVPSHGPSDTLGVSRRDPTELTPEFEAALRRAEAANTDQDVLPPLPEIVLLGRALHPNRPAAALLRASGHTILVRVGSTLSVGETLIQVQTITPDEVAVEVFPHRKLIVLR